MGCEYNNLIGISEKIIIFAIIVFLTTQLHIVEAITSEEEVLSPFLYDRAIKDFLINENNKIKNIDDYDSMIHKLDDEWKRNNTLENSLVKSIIENPISELLQTLNKDYEIVEIILTNNRGVNVAQFGMTTDYYQADEEWWNIAKDEGKFWNLTYDKSVEKNGLDVAMPITDENGKFLGVIKAFVDVTQLNADDLKNNSINDDLKDYIVDVGIILQNISYLDKINGVYQAKFIIYVESDELDFTNTPFDLQYENGFDLIKEKFMQKHYYEEKVTGKFYTDIDLHNYPIADIKLPIEIEATYPWDSSILIFNPVEVNIESKTHVVGLSYDEPTIESHIHRYPDGVEYSRIIVTLPIHKEETTSFLKVYFPVFLITAISMIIYYIPNNYTPRIYLTAPLLIALVYLHQSSLSNLPTLSYLTNFDKVMIIIYSIFTINTVSLGVQMRINELSKDIKKIRYMNRVFLLVVIIVIIMGGFLLFNEPISSLFEI